jgi:DnaJ homolog subfamily C member 28
MSNDPDEEPPAEDQSLVGRRHADARWQVGGSWEALVDRQIHEAMAEGKFDNLPHQGKPLPNDHNPYAADWGLAFHVLKNAGYAPPWIEADKEVRELLARRDAILARAADGPPPSELAQRRDRATIEDLVAVANAAIARVNADAPSPRQQRRRLVLADELARYDDACRRG